MLWLLGAICLFDYIWIISSDFSLGTSGLLATLNVAAIFLTLSLFLDRFYPKPIFQLIVNSVLFLFILTNLSAVFGYLLTSMAFPVQDANLSALDRFIGFDWLAWLGWMNENPVIGKTLTAAYHSSLAQVLILIFLLSLLNQTYRLTQFLRGYAISIICVHIFAGFLPATGAYIYYQPPPELFSNLNPEAGIWHYVHFTGLRDGSMRVLNLSQIEGLVTFPSFHTCLAILTTYAFRDNRLLFIVFAVLNAMVIVATLSEGGHHLIDLFGGACVAAFAIWVACVWDRKASMARVDGLPSRSIPIISSD